MGDRRGSVNVICGVTAIGTAVVMSALSAGATEVGHGDVERSTDVEMYVSHYGVRLAMNTSFDRDVTLSDARVHGAGDSDSAWLWPLDGLDHEGEDLDPISLPAGTEVAIEGTLQPDCSVTDFDGLVSFSVEVSHRNARLTASFTDELDVDGAARAYCALGPSIHAGGSTVRPDGTATVYLTILNPGPDPLRVKVPAYSDRQVTWRPADATVAAGERRELAVHGSHVDCDGSEVGSWEGGRLLVDGKPFTPGPAGAVEGWC